MSQKRFCYQCLGAHMIKDCEAPTACFNCNGKHHTLIHVPSKKSKVKNEASKRVQEEASSSNENSTTVRNVLAAVSFEKIDDDLEALLATPHVRISADEAPSAVIRALIDQCAQSSFVTEELCQRLRLKKRRVNVPISGSAKKSKKEGTIVCVHTEDRLDEQLKAFWEVKEPPHVLPWSSEDKMCEKHYFKHTVRLNDGRYQVRLHIKPNLPAFDLL
uniref:Uncharacterized protein n=1 Tax=Trichogramma kaykai TaxID=54128 RepID=A0ABD2XN52_9HYME